MTDTQSPKSNQTDADRKRVRLIKRRARSPYWSLEEGVVLAYDLDPDDAIRHPVTGYGNATLQAAGDVRALWDHAHRAGEMGLLEERLAPIAFMKWARSMGVEFHRDWWDAVVGEETPAKDEAEVPLPAEPFTELSTKEQVTLLKMVGGMAMAFYGWDRDALRSGVTAEITSDLDRVGVSLHPDTIRKWLKRSGDVLSGPDP
jgi:hypothetical protein